MWGSDLEKKEFGQLYPLFYGGEGERNYAKAVKSIRQLSVNGYAPAIYTLGYAYFDGKGVRKNLNIALEYYMRAAEASYPSAEGAVGNFFASANNEVCETDSEKAVLWWTRAAEHGNCGSQCNLAGWYLNGTGVRQDPVKAHIWASLAIHCSPIRIIPAEVIRDKALVLLNKEMKASADQRIGLLKGRLPYAWSEHLLYWRKLHQEAQSISDVS